MPKLASNRLARQNTRNPAAQKKRINKNIENLDIMDVYAARATLESRKAAGIAWRGGDLQDRQEYIAAEKKRLGSRLDRVLGKSSKRMPSGHYLKEDRAYLEFNEVVRGRDIKVNPCHQPAKMQWSIDEFEKQINNMRDL